MVEVSKINTEKIMSLFPERWLEYQRSDDYKERMKKAQSFLQENEE